jgi:hypothetical protein
LANIALYIRIVISIKFVANKVQGSFWEQFNVQLLIQSIEGSHGVKGGSKWVRFEKLGTAYNVK